MAVIPHKSIIENLELLARQVVEGFIIGLHKSPFHGFSVEFAEHRLYNQGDNLRYVDWKVYARNDRMFVKKFEEETNLRCCVAIDTSSSMYFPKEGDSSKLQFSIVAAACLFELLKKQLDASSLALFDEHLYELSPARSGQRHNRALLTQLDQLLSRPDAHKKTQTSRALHEIAERLHQRSLVILFSDMAETPEDPEELFSALQHLRYNKHEVILFQVGDSRQEWNFEFDNRPYEFVDMEDGSVLKLNPSDIREEYLRRIGHFRRELENRCHQYRIDLVNCDINEQVEQVLYRYLLKRNKMM